MPNFDTVFFDSGGTIFAEDPVSAAAAGDPDVSEHYARAPERVRHALASQGIELGEASLRRALVAAEPAARAAGGDAYTFVTLLDHSLGRVGLHPPREIVFYAADAYAGPRYPSWLFPGTREMLIALRDADIDLGIIANTPCPGFSMDRSYAGVGLGGLFRTRVFSGDEGVAKPDRRIFEIAAERARLGGERVLYVGNDCEFDGVGARAMGWPVALRRTPANETFQPDFLFDTWDQLLAVIGLT